MKEKKKIDDRVKPALISGLIFGSMLIGWNLNLFTQKKIPYSYRTDSMVLDTLAALGIRNYNP